MSSRGLPHHPNTSASHFQEQTAHQHPTREQQETSTHQVEQEQEAENLRLKRKYTPKRAYAWNHFTAYKDKNGKIRAQCKYCDSNYAADSIKNGTSAMNRHMKVCENHPDNDNTSKMDCNGYCHDMLGEQEGGEVSTVPKFDQEEARKALNYMVIVDELPFGFVESGGFRRFISAVCPQFVVPLKVDVMKDCLRMYFDEKPKLKAFFKESGQRVSLTIEIWTSNDNTKYMCLTSHFINEDWKLCKRMLNFLPCHSYKGDDVGLLVEECLNDWGIEKIFTITVDNASSNDTTVSYLRRRFVSKGQTVLGGKYLHMRCVAHIINLVVRDLLNDWNKSVNRVRTVVRYFIESSMWLEDFDDVVAEQKIDSEKYLCLDVPNRWRTVFNMLEAAVAFQRVFERYEACDAEFCAEFMLNGPLGKIGLPAKSDWIIVARLVRVLAVFFNVTNHISASQYVTSNTLLDEIIDIDDVIKEWMNSDDLIMVDIVTRMKLKFDKYWGNIEKMNMMLYVAIILDPRCKASYVRFVMKNMYGDEIGHNMTKLANNALKDLFDEYKIVFAPTMPSSASASVCGGGSTMTTSEAEQERDANRPLSEMEKKDETELEMYLRQSLETDNGSFDLLDWWKVHAKNYPVLSRLARDVLAMPISTMASEVAFSIGGRVISDYRAALPPMTREALFCLKSWILRDTSKTVEEEDYIIIDKVAHDLSGVSLNSAGSTTG